MYPIEKYKFFTQKTPRGIKTIAVTTYAGKTVRGSAICDVNDTYDEKFGQELAAARCAVKVAQKRRNRALAKVEEANIAADKAEAHWTKMDDYLYDAEQELELAEARVRDITG